MINNLDREFVRIRKIVEIAEGLVFEPGDIEGNYVLGADLGDFGGGISPGGSLAPKLIS